MTKKLKLYVWEEVLCDYTCGVMFALAENVAEARNTILEENSKYKTVVEQLKARPRVYSKPIGFAIWGGG